MERKPSRIYYNHKGFWKGLAAFKKLAKEPGMSENVAKALADEASHLADLFAYPEAYPETNF